MHIHSAELNRSRVFILEHIVPGPAESHFSKLFDIHMMCWGTGQERTEEGYASILEASGWRFVGCHYPSHASGGSGRRTCVGSAAISLVPGLNNRSRAAVNTTTR